MAPPSSGSGGGDNSDQDQQQPQQKIRPPHGFKIRDGKTGNTYMWDDDQEKFIPWSQTSEEV